jgi:hypothetical protein
MVMDDDFYDAWQYYPDSRDQTRRGSVCAWRCAASSGRIRRPAT